MGVKKHDSEVDLILDDIRDTLLPKKNPDCTFITRRQDKRIQEKLLDVSESREDVWGALVYSRDQEQTAVGWQNIIPYPKYVDKSKTVVPQDVASNRQHWLAKSRCPAKRAFCACLRTRKASVFHPLYRRGHADAPLICRDHLPGAPKDGVRRTRQTNPVDSSTIVRHLQERIRKWADRKPSCLYGRKTYQSKVPASSFNTPQAKVKIISSIELPHDGEQQQQQQQTVQYQSAISRSNSNEQSNCSSALNSPDKLPVSWNILSQNEAAHLNLQTYGMDANVTYVPARTRISSHISNYTASKQSKQHDQKRQNTRTGGVLHPARVPRYHHRKTLNRSTHRGADATMDMTEEAADHAPAADSGRTPAGTVKYRDKYKCSICIEGLQVADWPSNFEYTPSNARLPLNTNTGISESMRTYKDVKSGGSADPKDSAAPGTGALDLGAGVRAVPWKGTTAAAAAATTAGQLHYGSTAALRDQQQAPSTGVAAGTQAISKANLLDLQQLVVKAERPRASPRRALQEKKKSSGAPSLEKSCRLIKKINSERVENRVPSLYDRFQAAKSGGKRRPRKMYGVSICDVYEGQQETDQDMFSYGLFLATPLATPPSKQKLDPLMNITPVHANKLHMQSH